MSLQDLLPLVFPFTEEEGIDAFSWHQLAQDALRQQETSMRLELLASKYFPRPHSDLVPRVKTFLHHQLTLDPNQFLSHMYHLGIEILYPLKVPYLSHAHMNNLDQFRFWDFERPFSFQPVCQHEEPRGIMARKINLLRHVNHFVERTREDVLYFVNYDGNDCHFWLARFSRKPTTLLLDAHEQRQQGSTQYLLLSAREDLQIGALGRHDTHPLIFEPPLAAFSTRGKFLPQLTLLLQPPHHYEAHAVHVHHPPEDDDDEPEREAQEEGQEHASQEDSTLS